MSVEVVPNSAYTENDVQTHKSKSIYFLNKFWLWYPVLVPQIEGGLLPVCPFTAMESEHVPSGVVVAKPEEDGLYLWVYSFNLQTWESIKIQSNLTNIIWHFVYGECACPCGRGSVGARIPSDLCV